MKNTPSALKWLAEKRGRLAHDLSQTQRIAIELNHRVETLQVDLAAVDRALQLYDSTIDAERIEPVRAHTRYGSRGAFRSAIVRILQAHSPEWVATDNVEALVCVELSLSFATAAERKRWYDNSLRKQLKRLVEEGAAERRQDAQAGAADMGHWRWVAQ